MAIPIPLDLSTRKSTPGVSEHVCTQASVGKNCAGRRPRRQMCRGASECAECWTGRVKGCGHGHATRDVRRAAQRVCWEARVSFISTPSHAAWEANWPSGLWHQGWCTCLPPAFGVAAVSHPAPQSRSIERNLLYQKDMGHTRLRRCLIPLRGVRSRPFSYLRDISGRKWGGSGAAGTYAFVSTDCARRKEVVLGHTSAARVC